MTTLQSLNEEICSCRKCPRLVAWREKVAEEKIKRFATEDYWGKPVPGFGDSKGRLLIVGLAPAAHGANRTGRMFTGDKSGEWLYRALYKFGFANRAESVAIYDGMKLNDCYITAAVRCAPPDNKPLPKEFANCKPFLLREIELFKHVEVVVGLGRIGFLAALNAYKEAKGFEMKRLPQFSHGAELKTDTVTFIGSYHPSQQNTFTGKLTEKMFDAVFRRCREVLEKE
ncbi:MAG TPA: uracil-DNA glycosylase [Candidatus Kapabacteria bacterium]|nr:uracil-DNA glycosylase [Candidatus Kapabacteria bacterium]